MQVKTAFRLHTWKKTQKHQRNNNKSPNPYKYNLFCLFYLPGSYFIQTQLL